MASMSTGQITDSAQKARDDSRDDEPTRVNAAVHFAGGDAGLAYRLCHSAVLELLFKLKTQLRMGESTTAPPHRQVDLAGSDQDELSAEEYEMIKSQALALLHAELLDSPEAHLNYISSAVAGALSKHVGT
jgi:hypothetical protein